MKNKSYIAKGKKEVDRLAWIKILGILIWSIMIIRVFQVQVIQSGEYASRLERQSLKRVLIKPDRGRILDRNGDALVLNADVKIKLENRTRKLKRLHPYGALAGQVLGRIDSCMV